MALPAGQALPCSARVKVVRRVLPGEPMPEETPEHKQKREKEKRAKAKMGIGEGPSRDMIMKSFAQSGDCASSACSGYSDYLLWWNGLRDESTCSDFLADLVLFCLSLHDTKIRKTNKSWFNGAQLTHKSTFTMARQAGMTIHHITCLFSIRHSPKLEAALSSWHTAVVNLSKERNKDSGQIKSTILDSPVLVHSIILLEKAMNASSSSQRLSGVRSKWRSRIISALLESTYVESESEEAAIAADGGVFFDGSFHADGEDDGSVGEGGTYDDDRGGPGADERSNNDFVFSTAGSFPFSLSVVYEAMRWMFPSTETKPGEQKASEVSGLYMVYEAIGQLLKNLYKSLRSQADVTQSTFLSVLHTLKSLLKRFPILSTDFIAGLHDALLPYLRWPSPYGSAASHMLGILEAEAKSPGAALRRWHMTCRPIISRKGHRLLDLYTASKKDGNPAADAALESIRLWNRIGSTVFLYYDHESALSSTFAELIRQVYGDSSSSSDNTGWGKVESPYSHDLLDVQRMIITQVVDAEFILLNLNSGDHASAAPPFYVKSAQMDPLGLQRATASQVSSWFRVVVDVADHDFVESSGEQQDWRPANAFDCREARQETLRQLVTTISSELGIEEELELIPRGDRGENDRIASLSSNKSEGPSDQDFDRSNNLSDESVPAVHRVRHVVHAAQPLDPCLAVDAQSIHASEEDKAPAVLDLSEDRLLGYNDQTLKLSNMIRACLLGWNYNSEVEDLRSTDYQEDHSLRIAVLAHGKTFHKFLCNFVRACMLFSDSTEVEDDNNSAASMADFMASDLGQKQFEKVSLTQRKQFKNAFKAGAIRVFPIPTGASDISSYLAATDGLYYRRIHSMFANQLEYVPRLPLINDPQKELCLPERVSIHEDNAAPMRLAPSIFMDYVSTAEEIVKVQLYICECWPFEEEKPAAASTGNESGNPSNTALMGEYVNLAEILGDGKSPHLAAARRSKRESLVSAKRSSVSSVGSMVSSSGTRRKRLSQFVHTQKEDVAPLVVPFMTRVEIGVSAAIEEYLLSKRDEGHDKIESNDTRSVSNSMSNDWDRHLMSKEFHTFWNSTKHCTPALQIKFTENGLDGEPLPLFHEQHLQPDMQYASVCVSNLFKYTCVGSEPYMTSTTRIDHRVPCSPGTHPEKSSLGLRCMPMNQTLSDALKKRKLNADEVTSFNTQMRTDSEAKQQHAGIIDIRSKEKDDGFSVLIDGNLYGPMKRVR